MWSEDLDKKLQNAAAGNESSYDEKSWDKMATLLDKHLPREKRRKPILLLIFIAMFVGSVVFMVSQRHADVMTSTDSKTTTVEPGQKAVNAERNEKSVSTKSLAPIEKSDVVTEPTSIGNERNDVSETSEKKKDRSSKAPISGGKSIEPNNVAVSSNTSKTLPNTETKTETKTQLKARTINNRDVAINAPAKKTMATTKEARQAIDDVTATKEKSRTEVNPSLTVPADTKTATVDNNTQRVKLSDPVKNDKADMTADKSVVKNEDKKDLAENKTTEKLDSKEGQRGRGKKVNDLSVLFSIGPDVSGVGNRIGRLNVQYGIGLSYPVTKGLAVRAGFYAARKIYNADSADYHPPKGFWGYYRNLTNIDANCLVYEIPVSVVYNFNPGAKNSWFVSGGVSSVIMKSEKYGYSLKDAWGRDDYVVRKVRNENAHFLSTLTVSGGYQYKVSDRFSLMAEPYMKLPLSGIGFGKVRLSSAGVLVTASLKPFKH